MARQFLAVVLAVTLLNLLCGFVCSFTPTTVSRARPSRSQPRSAYVGPRTAQNSNRFPSRAHSYPNQAPSSLLHLNRCPHTSSSFALAAITVDGPPTTLGNSFDIHKFGDEYSLWLDSFNGTSSSVLCHTSPNGLSFSPNPSSVDESASLSPNADDWWYFDTHSVSVGSVLPASTGDGKECLLMYYTGKDGSGRQRVGTAVTQNGVDWGRIEGPEPNGNLFSGEENSNPTVVRSGERSYMFFQREEKICLATMDAGKFEFR
ncbi:hypothetical protein TL16_g07231 [Triparma laevis f. inornata]|uniref:Arabinanase/levansucrase/invertase n=2 Tax=Triparma laevis TaxID=1534972 RepID=A0A9W7KZ48_9STRA|nr:hypothetical protein TL16_g07231 [Triparma laevis f. inornata]GMI17238.1 hypothetical protein TrLO_g3299 [Triparma laevis f. longispina]